MFTPIQLVPRLDSSQYIAIQYGTIQHITINYDISPLHMVNGKSDTKIQTCKHSHHLYLSWFYECVNMSKYLVVKLQILCKPRKLKAQLWKSTISLHYQLKIYSSVSVLWSSKISYFSLCIRIRFRATIVLSFLWTAQYTSPYVPSLQIMLRIEECKFK